MKNKDVRCVAAEEARHDGAKRGPPRPPPSHPPFFPSFPPSPPFPLQFLDSHVIYDRDFNFNFFGFKTLERSYLLKLDGEVAERPQHMFMRVAVGMHGDDMERVLETYNYMSEGYFTHASPTLFNSGTPTPQLSR